MGSAIAKKNYKFFHSIFSNNVELHHIFGRLGVMEHCLHFFYPAPHGHQNNGKWIKELREKYREDYLTIVANGCRKGMYKECEKCAVESEE